MDDVLTLPGLRPDPVESDAPSPSAAEMRRALALSAAETARRAASADPVEVAVALLLSQHGAEADAAADCLLQHVEREEACAPEARSWPANLYLAASAAVSAGRVNEAVSLLAALADLPAGRADALLGLAVCATRLRCYDEALVLALESRKLGPGHPRASSVAGMCELERGNRRAAQAHFAAAARLARRDPRFHDDLRLVQRSLLLMHLA
jgi:tetratricopeptide (TPR) repeat protein